jgi:hypothetical protein
MHFSLNLSANYRGTEVILNFLKIYDILKFYIIKTCLAQKICPNGMNLWIKIKINCIKKIATKCSRILVLNPEFHYSLIKIAAKNPSGVCALSHISRLNLQYAWDLK